MYQLRLEMVTNSFLNVPIGNGNEVLQRINSFVDSETRGFIKAVLNSPLPSDTKMALVNVLYFKGTWRKKLSNKDHHMLFNAQDW